MILEYLGCLAHFWIARDDATRGDVVQADEATRDVGLSFSCDDAFTECCESGGWYEL